MDNGIILILVIVAAVIGAGIAWYALRKNLHPAAAWEVAEAVAYVKDLLSDVVTEAEVEAVATWVYRSMKTGSQYYSEEEFVDLVTRAVMRALENKASIAQLLQADSAFAAELKQVRKSA